MSSKSNIQWVLLALLFSATGCGTLRYLVQAGRGQLALVNRARPIAEVIKDPRTDPRTKQWLQEVPQIKEFGQSQGLKPNKNYTEYVALDRAAVVWVVTGCRPLQFEPKVWSFPIVGSFTYLGWFDEKDAHEFAQDLESDHWDVDVREAGAYSTLGWFRDSVLSTMLPRKDERIGFFVNILLHESVHHTYYVNGQSYFNESFAEFVADKMTQDYLKQRPGSKQDNQGTVAAYLRQTEENEKRKKILHDTYESLEKVYESNLSDAEKLTRKQKILEEIKTKLRIQGTLNNATLVQYKTYSGNSETYQKIWNHCQKDWKRFWGLFNRLPLQKYFESDQQENLEPMLQKVLKEDCSG